MADDRFYVKTLRMQNFRCFEDVTLGPFDPHFNLLVGENGAGKSSVLVALASLFRDIPNVPAGIAMGPLVNEADIKYKQQNTTPVASISRSIEFSASFDWFGKEFSHGEVTKFPRFNATGNAGRLQSFDSDHVALYIDDRADKTYPLMAQFTTIRQFHRPANLRRIDENAPSSLRWNAFPGWSNAGASADELRLWLRDVTLAALQGHADQSSALSLVQLACAQAVEGAVDVSFVQMQGDIVVSFNDGRSLTFSNMSDGQRALVGLIAEIARRACILNWDILHDQTLTETPGLVLIDEIDLHLHPKWQRQIVPALKKIFPKIQFFATTHSPQVIGEARPDEIVLLTPQGQKRPSVSYGMDSNWVLECVMDAEKRDPEIAKRLKKLFDTIEDGHFAKARAQIRKLQKDIGYTPDIVGAESFMWRMEHLGDEAAE